MPDIMIFVVQRPTSMPSVWGLMRGPARYKHISAYTERLQSKKPGRMQSRLRWAPRLSIWLSIPICPAAIGPSSRCLPTFCAVDPQEVFFVRIMWPTCWRSSEQACQPPPRGTVL